MYKAGSVAALIGKEKDEPENRDIANLFSFTSGQKGEERDASTEQERKGKRRNISADIADSKRKKRQKRGEEDTETELSRPRRNRKRRDPDQEERTLFVGNLPSTISKKDIIKLFHKHGQIESVRIRSAAPADPKTRKRAVVINKEFHPDIPVVNSYVVFKEREDALKAVKMNGVEYQEHHLRIDLATQAKKHNTRKSVFVGNLPFDVTEEAVRQHFQDCGRIENVRLVRDAATRIGKGIGYVTFEDDSSISLAMKLDGHKLKGRKLRIQRAVKKEKVKKEADGDTKHSSKNRSSSSKGKVHKKTKYTIQESGSKTETSMKTSGYKGVTSEKETRQKVKKKKLSKKNKLQDRRKQQIYLSKTKGQKDKSNKAQAARHTAKHVVFDD